MRAVSIYAHVHCRTTTDTLTSAGDSVAGTSATSDMAASTTTSVKQTFSAVIPPPSFEQFLLQIIVLGVVMFYFYLCDYRKVTGGPTR